MNILFICKFNRYRSKAAEAYFNKINKNKNFKAKSAGLIRGEPINKKVTKILEKIGVAPKGKPRGLDREILKWQDILVIVGDNVPPSIFKDKRISGKKLIVWKINEGNNSINLIKRKVEKLVKDLKSKDE
ncbi:MAG: hypothetical protein Q8O84_03370 [Nanoarchaeota archaeon]|nr:hypothetical protein [Nanoarchaeota archaeon]